MKKILKILGIVALVFIAFLFVSYLMLNEKLPQSTPSEEADLMAESMLKAMNKEAWDSTKTVSWTFRGEHHYDWNRVENEVLVTWGDYEVRLDPESITGEIENPINHSRGKKPLNWYARPGIITITIVSGWLPPTNYSTPEPSAAS